MKHNHDKVEKDAFIVIQPVICYNKKYKIGGDVKMTYNAFLFPEAILDTPRLFTAVAEWLAVFVYFNICRRRVDQKRYIVYCILSATSMILFQFIAGILPIVFWFPMMMGAVGLMYAFLYLVLDVMPKDCGVITVHAFVLAEFSASVYRQFYVWGCNVISADTFLYSAITMTVMYTIVYTVYYRVEKANIHPEIPLNINAHELFLVLLTGIGAFIMGNISFVWTETPISAGGSLLYVRTLVDFAGMLMLMTQMGRRNELAIKTENDEINRLFKKQYEQYRTAVENSELLRKEMHDMKHYLAALKSEENPVRRNEVLADMEQAIAVQEAFMNTGNQVLDVILTTKSQQCQKRGIILQAMIDGTALSGIHVKDICSLFGNILDNAIEATQQVPCADKRLINLSVRRQKEFIIIECENYSENVIEIEKSRALPSTTKGDKIRHGIGLKSIRKVTEKYGGAIMISSQDGWFKVRILLGA